MDENARVVFYRWFRGILDANAVVLHRLIMSDRAIFTSLGMPINKTANTGAIRNHTVCSDSSTV
jgi:hypothetical protein